ncbi:glycoside hydrolase family 30 protein [Mycena maculata]|uniref:Glycoside hydrolase family 30 protein n=1 Tax=Mycena maculata TaxID=230809 RepID=A0AAD7J2Z4_9AGAR|nr:glycoside hydrolase family 30 protein [Mycena maculata]
MHTICVLSILGAFSRLVAGQEIAEIWQTLEDQSKLFAPLNLSQPATFSAAKASATADITVDETTAYQTVLGFGASLTDSAAQSLSQLKSKNAAAYSELLQKLFDPTFDASSAGITYLRVPLGASDFSNRSYSYDDTPGDTQLSKFNIAAAPSYVFEVLNDIQTINHELRVHVLPWSPPGWMKSSKTMNGGNFTSDMAETYAKYLLKALQGFDSEHVQVYAISIQNEVLNSNPTYPSCKMTYQDEGAIGTALRPLMNNNGFSAVKLIGYEHNWSGYKYPISLMKSYGDVFDGVSFHCYGGTVDDQDKFYQAYPNKDIHFTECTGMDGAAWWGDLSWQAENIFIGAIEHHAQNALVWNLISGEELPSSTSCGKDKKRNSCRAVVTANANGTYVLNEEYYNIAQAARAVIPRDVGGPFGKLIRSTVAPGNRTSNLHVNAFATGRAKAGDPTRYSLHVLNMAETGTYTIAFQGKQASYSFPKGLSTIGFYA